MNNMPSSLDDGYNMGINNMQAMAAAGGVLSKKQRISGPKEQEKEKEQLMMQNDATLETPITKITSSHGKTAMLPPKRGLTGGHQRQQ